MKAWTFLDDPDDQQNIIAKALKNMK